MKADGQRRNVAVVRSTQMPPILNRHVGLDEEKGCSTLLRKHRITGTDGDEIEQAGECRQVLASDRSRSEILPVERLYGHCCVQERGMQKRLSEFVGQPRQSRQCCVMQAVSGKAIAVEDSIEVQQMVQAIDLPHAVEKMLGLEMVGLLEPVMQFEIGLRRHHEKTLETKGFKMVSHDRTCPATM
ncbi:hypothetical protein [Rhizobium sp. PDO1-076]|uniref:hypothetical protein n=1 Tax=Rhizobium sp. PDO1-076 TaxID=1125979 RepID=UPI00178C57A0|nr:hypothetical protein [Rhizobium sp. PDO1-076]